MLTIVVAAVLERDGQILIAQRKPTGAHPLKWEFPGGKVEPGEDPVAGLRRELQEELGIEAVIGPEITRYNYQYPGRSPILLIFYGVTEFGGEPQNLVFERIAWEKPGRLPAYDFLDGDIAFVRMLGLCNGPE
ncbi:MAG TPA: (deoxy)nucleoside triphosphate pyrophosphohydrolase [Bryobacteraceae bacterium]|nr:(deoxy)nucleoside triphosphate pyrophosphohydrolase [Bryobacteraceae bacterium]